MVVGDCGLYKIHNISKYPGLFNSWNPWAMVEGNKADLDSPTWENLIKLFAEAGVNFHKCYFSNVFIGLRDMDKTAAKFLGAINKDFVNWNSFKYKL